MDGRRSGVWWLEKDVVVAGVFVEGSGSDMVVLLIGGDVKSMRRRHAWVGRWGPWGQEEANSVVLFELLACHECCVCEVAARDVKSRWSESTEMAA